jgi:hypothetical protein
MLYAKLIGTIWLIGLVIFGFLACRETNTLSRTKWYHVLMAWEVIPLIILALYGLWFVI